MKGKRTEGMGCDGAIMNPRAEAPLLWENPVKRRLQNGKVVIGTFMVQWVQPSTIQILRDAGFDFVILDMEHSALSWETVANALLAARAIGITCFVRVPEITRAWTGRALDAGAHGLMFPRVETVDQVRKIIELTKYPPMGARGVVWGKAHTDFRSVDAQQYMRTANAELLNVVQIETCTGVKNMEAICRTIGRQGGIDVLGVARDDLTASMGIPGELDNPSYLEIVQKSIRLCTENGLFPYKGANHIEMAREWVAKGARFIFISNEVGMLREKANEMMRQLRELQASEK
jgi:4-hydroxy-2-oxoheptanedioate aldolase